MFETYIFDITAITSLSTRQQLRVNKTFNHDIDAPGKLCGVCLWSSKEDLTLYIYTDIRLSPDLSQSHQPDLLFISDVHCLQALSIL